MNKREVDGKEEGREVRKSEVDEGELGRQWETSGQQVRQEGR